MLQQTHLKWYSTGFGTLFLFNNKLVPTFHHIILYSNYHATIHNPSVRFIQPDSLPTKPCEVAPKRATVSEIIDAFAASDHSRILYVVDDEGKFIKKI